jgi:hypothetical protein
VRTSDTHVHTRLLDLRQIWESVESRNIFLFLMVTAPVLCCCGPATACRMCRMYSYVFETLTWYIHTSTLIFGVGVLLSLADQSVVRVCRVVLRHLDEFSRSVSPFVLSFCITTGRVISSFTSSPSSSVSWAILTSFLWCHVHSFRLVPPAVIMETPTSLPRVNRAHSLFRSFATLPLPL